MLKKTIYFILCFLIWSCSEIIAVETVIRVAFDPNLPPYQFIEEGKNMGIHIDAMNEIAKKNNFIVEYMPIQSRSKCFEALENGKVDAVLGVENSRHSEENVYFDRLMKRHKSCEQLTKIWSSK